MTTLVVVPKFISYPFSIPAEVGDFLIAKRVFMRCVVPVSCRETLVHLIEFDMVNIDVIVGIN